MSDPLQKDKTADSDVLTSDRVNPLDLIFNDEGSLPPARIGIRALAFLLDFILVSAVATIIIWKIILPQTHPGTFHEFILWGEQLTNWFNSNERSEIALPKPNHNLSIALNFANDLQLLTFWLYFALSEALFAVTIGKKACRLRTISTITLSPPPFVTGVIRGGLITAVFFFIPPVGLVASVSTLLFNKRRQMGHDLLSRTIVIDEKILSSVDIKSV